MKKWTNTFAHRAAYLLFTLALSSLPYAILAQSVWTGGAGTTNWNTPGNWTGGVPATGKTVTIYNCTTCPVITTTGNQAAFVQVYAGGKLTVGSAGSLAISNPGGPGLKTHATSQVNISTGANLSIQNFWGEGLAVGGAFNNNGTVSVNGGHTGIAVSAGATLANGTTGTINVTGSTLNYGVTSSGNVTNQGVLTLDDANNDGISQHAGVMNLGGTINITRTGVNAIFSKASINHSGVMTINNGLNGIYVLTGGVFNNGAGGKITIGGSTFMNTGIYNFPGTFKNNGELTINNALSKGIENSSNATFENVGKITLGNTGFAGIFNVGGAIFTNKPCALIETSTALVNYATFTNKGIIKSTAAGVSSLGINDGAAIGAFTVASGNVPITESAYVWTGCANTNWADAGNWFPATVPVLGSISKAIVQNVAQASGNAPRVSSAVASPFLFLHNGANLTIASGGSLGISDGMLGNGYLEVRQGGLMTVQAGGSFSSSSVVILGGTVNNSGNFNLPAPFHSAGTFGMTGGTFNNLSGGTFNGTIGQAGLGVNANLSGGATFNNFGSLTIGGSGGIFLNQSTMSNKSSGLIVIAGGGLLGKVEVMNSSTFQNMGMLAVGGNLNISASNFQNSGQATISQSTGVGILLGNGTLSNTGTLNVTGTAGHGIYMNNVGNLTNSATVNLTSLGQAGIWTDPGTSISNLAGGKITINGTANAGITTHAGVNNAGTMDFTGLGHAGIGIYGGPFVNTATGVIKITTAEDGIGTTMPIENSGTITINNINFRGLTITNTGSLFNKASGKIEISNTNDIGFFNTGTLVNSGFIRVKDTHPEDGIATTNSFTNNATGIIEINNIGNAGAGLWVISGSFSNSGAINIDGTALKGIDNWQGTFTNQPSGQINIKNTAWFGLENGNVFENHGTISINGAGWGGINNYNWKFDNGPGGVVTINNAYGGPGIQTANGFFNSGSITVTNSSTAVLIHPTGYLNNHPCASVAVDSMVEIQNVFNNWGHFKTTYPGSNVVSGLLNNYGLLEDFYGSFTGVPFNNSAVRVHPISGTVGGFIQNALEIGTNSPFQIGTTWYRNANLTNPGGTYNPGVNTFTPTVGVGTHTLYFTIKDLVNNCTKTVSVQVSIASALIGLAGNEESEIVLYNYPNPFADETRIKFSLPFDATGKLVVYDNLGRLTGKLYEGELMKDELYEFSLDASGMRATGYLAVLVLDDGRSFSIRLAKVDN